jgi:hypothetical protein
VFIWGDYKIFGSPTEAVRGRLRFWIFDWGRKRGHAEAWTPNREAAPFAIVAVLAGYALQLQAGFWGFVRAFYF